MTKTIPPEHYAFPIAPGNVRYWQPGMTLRDYFAANVIAACIDRNVALIDESSAIQPIWTEAYAESVEDAYVIADMMMEEGEKYT